MQPPREGYAAKSIIYVRYAEVDPEAAVERILAAGTSEQSLLQQVFRAWAKYDLDAARQQAETLPPIHRRAAGAAVLSVGEDLGAAQQEEIAATFGLRRQLEQMRAAETIGANPADAWRRTLAAPPSQQRESRLLHIAARWAERDPERALTAVGELPRTARRQDLQRNLMTRWTMTDRDAARRWLQAQPASDTHWMTAGFAGGLAQSAPHEALDFTLGLPADERREAVQAVVDVWADADPRAAAEALAALGDHTVVTGLAENLMQKWAHVDPVAAVQWIATHEEAAQQDWRPFIPLIAVAEHDPEGALALALALRGEAQSRGTSVVLSTWGSNAPRAAAAWMQRTSREIDAYAVMTVARPYALVDLDEALDWLESMPSEQRHAALRSLVHESESLAEASRIVDRIDDPESREEAIFFVAELWARREPKEAIGWVERNARDQPASLHGEIIQVWAGADYEAAVAYIPQLRAQTQRDAAYSKLALVRIYDDTLEAERLYNRIRGYQARQETAHGFYLFWLERDPEQAERYREAAEIPSTE